MLLSRPVDAVEPLDPVQGPTTRSDWRAPWIGRPEQTLVGVQYLKQISNVDYIVKNSSHWVYAGTGLKDGDVVPGIVGYEADALMSQYTLPKRIQRATANVLNAFLNGAPPTITGFTPASAPVGTSVSIIGTDFKDATSVKVNGANAAFTGSTTTIQATVPSGATTGALSVTTPGGTATSASNFTVTAKLTVNKQSGPLGVGNGTVTSNTGGINCGPRCSADYAVGTMPTVVTLTATPNTLAIFNGWNGCDTVSGATCTVAMGTAKTVTANFLP